jgi:hypothetical protein
VIDVRSRLLGALHSASTLPALREALVLIVCDLTSEDAVPTVRSAEAAPDTEPESAPPTPADSDLGRQFGV